jgi:preprotein translocase subunit SecE
MNAKLEQGAPATPADIAKYTLAALIVLAGLVGFYWFADWPGALRGALVGVSLAIAGVVFVLTERGRATMEFLSETRFELRKVIWPTREDTLRSTGLIVVVVIIISLLLGFIDFLVSHAVRYLLG